MRRVQNSTPITDFGGRKQISFDALFSSDSEDDVPIQAQASSSHTVASPSHTVASPSHAVASPAGAPPSPDFPYCREDDPISVWTQKVTESFEKAGKKQLPPDFKESLGRLSFFRKPQSAKEIQQNSVPKEETSTAAVHPK